MHINLYLLKLKFPFVLGFACTENCHGRMVAEYDELALHTQLKCLEALFDVPRMQNKRKLNDVA